LCLAFIPYYDIKYNLDSNSAKTILRNYFSIVDTVESFTLTGGEPLINKELNRILTEVFKYDNQITEKICIVTNGTIKPKQELLDVLASNDKTFVVLSNYGSRLSKNLVAVVNLLEKNNIAYRVEDYNDDIKYGGWIDYRDHSLKHKTEIDVQKQAQNCLFFQGEYFDINFGELHPCSRSFWRMHKSIIKRDKSQYIDLNNIKFNISEGREILREIRKLSYYNSCAHCGGNKEDTIRHKPAVQL
jgi:organic radical activating enzyme